MEITPSPELKREIKQLILEALKITHVTADEIKDDISLFEEGNSVQIDSVDALEIVMVLQRKYHVHIDDQNIGRYIIKSIDTMAEFVAKEQAKQAAQG